jgi:hypothetical protein
MNDRFKKILYILFFLAMLSLGIFLWVRFRTTYGLAGLLGFGAMGAVANSPRAKATAQRIIDTVGEIRESNNRIETGIDNATETTNRIEERVTELEELSDDSRQLRERINATDNRLDNLLSKGKDS